LLEEKEIIIEEYNFSNCYVIGEDDSVNIIYFLENLEICGNDVCEENENCQSCPSDCGSCSESNFFGRRGSGGGGTSFEEKGVIDKIVESFGLDEETPKSSEQPITEIIETEKCDNCGKSYRFIYMIIIIVIIFLVVLFILLRYFKKKKKIRKIQIKKKKPRKSHKKKRK